MTLGVGYLNLNRALEIFGPPDLFLTPYAFMKLFTINGVNIKAFAK